MVDPWIRVQTGRRRLEKQATKSMDIGHWTQDTAYLVDQLLGS